MDNFELLIVGFVMFTYVRVLLEKVWIYLYSSYGLIRLVLLNYYLQKSKITLNIVKKV